MIADAIKAPHAGAVRARTRIARRALFLARVAESLHLGAAAALFALVLIVSVGGRTDRIDSALIALLCGALVSLTWAIEHVREPRAIALRLDRALLMNGQFLTAWEQDGERRGGVLAELLVERAAREVPGRVAARRVLPHSWPILASPFLVGALLLGLVQGEDPGRAVLREQRARLATELGDLAGSARGEGEVLNLEQERALRALVRSAAALAEGTAAPQSEAAGASLVQDLRELGRELPGGSELASRLDELAGRLETGSAGQAAGGTPGEESEPGDGSGGLPLARTSADGTIVGREFAPGALPGPAERPEAAWVDPGALAPDLVRILDDWNASPRGDDGR